MDLMTTFVFLVVFVAASSLAVASACVTSGADVPLPVAPVHAGASVVAVVGPISTNAREQKSALDNSVREGRGAP